MGHSLSQALALAHSNVYAGQGIVDNLSPEGGPKKIEAG